MPPNTNLLDRLLAAYGGERDPDIWRMLQVADSDVAHVAAAVRRVAECPIDVRRIRGLEEVGELENRMASEAISSFDDPVASEPESSPTVTVLDRGVRLEDNAVFP